MADELHVTWLGLVEYREALDLQRRLAAARAADAVPDTLLLLEHPPVYTRGRRTESAELPMGEAWYRTQGIDVVDVDRGGHVTYHGPGQLVGYPIMRVASVRDHVRRMEDAIVSALHEEGVHARVRDGEGVEFLGVWVEDRKIASVGVHASRGVTTHGFAVNVQNDLQPFSWVVPCGLDGVRMTSLIAETGRTPDQMACLRKRIAYRFAQACGLRQRLVSPARVRAQAGVQGTPDAGAPGMMPV